MNRATFFAVGLLICQALAGKSHAADAWQETRAIAALQARQAAAADDKFVYAITNSQVAQYDRVTGERVAVSTGNAEHLNSGFLQSGRLYCAHSNFPKQPERSEIKVLSLDTMQLATF